jgi:A/G-specific adenine glycosylase
MDFSARLLKWYEGRSRILPWRESQDPYIIWISEVILQQTRMEQGIKYFHRFTWAFPDVQSLAAASEQQVLRLWQGLGYYSRARNLHQAAREIAEDRDGLLPVTFEEWLSVRGVGPYTAAAIASIAFKEVVPAVDGNVCRVLARLFALPYEADSGKGRAAFAELARELIDHDAPGDFNQAMMDFGSLVCRPVGPLCQECLFNRECLAFIRNEVSSFPVRKSARKTRDRFFNYFMFVEKADGQDPVFFVRQRKENDIWKNMYELPLLETPAPVSGEEIISHPWWQQLFPEGSGFVFVRAPQNYTHKLTHQTIHASMYQLETDSCSAMRLKNIFLPVDLSQFETLPKPRLMERFIRHIDLL